MIIDADQDFAAVRSVLGGRFDVCIAGAGVAGITLAHVLSTRGLNVVLLEGGGEDYEDQSQDLYTGQNIGRAYFDLDISRLRYFGGTSNHWNGVCRPLDASDFHQRAYADLSGWPISRDDLDPYQPATTDILGLEPFRDDVEVPGSNGNLRSIKFEERDNDPVRFAGKFGDEIRASEAITALLNTNLVDIDVDDGNGRITGFQVRGYAEGGETLTVKADRYVLALGAIENARMLLSCDRQMPAGIGNHSDFVGRCFMEHPHVAVGYYVLSSARAKELYEQPSTAFDEMIHLAASPALMDRANIGNCTVHMWPTEESDRYGGFAGGLKLAAKRLACSEPILEDLARSLGRFECPPPFDGAGLLRAAAEQVPNPASRVMLGQETDRFGLRKTVLDWQVLPVDKRTVVETALAIARTFADADLGRVKLFDWLLDEDADLPDVANDKWRGIGWHHMGTTRMADSPARGVVDANCAVYGSDNLFLAGSSLFSTGGAANPTYTIVQLSLRLADHLAGLARS